MYYLLESMVCDYFVVNDFLFGGCVIEVLSMVVRFDLVGYVISLMDFCYRYVDFVFILCVFSFYYLVVRVCIGESRVWGGIFFIGKNELVVYLDS